MWTATAYGGHGGKDETSAMMHLYPDTVDISELKKMEPMPYWAEDAKDASSEHGRIIAEKIISSWVGHLKQDKEESR